MRIKSVEYISPYKLKLRFSDEKTKIVDFEDWINEGGVYLLPLKKIEYFKKVKIDEFDYTICWPNGANFCPDVLYSIGEDMKEKIPQKKKSVSSASRGIRRNIAAKIKR